MSLFIFPGFAPAVPLTHARIGINSIVSRTNLTGPAALAGTSLQSLANPLTYEGYRPSTSPTSIVIDAGSPVAVDYVGIAAHTLAGRTVLLQSSTDNSTYTTRLTMAVTSNGTIMGLFAPVTARYWRIQFSWTVSPTIGVLYIGKTLEMQREIYGGHSPITLSRSTVIQPNLSDTGQWVGRSVIRKGFVSSYDWRHLKADWYRANFDPFVQQARTRPFFLAWRPASFPECVYGWSTGDIQPSNMGIRDLMSVSMSVEGYDGRDS